MDTDPQAERAIIVRRIQLFCLLLVLACIIAITFVSFKNLSFEPPASSPLLMSALWIAVFAAAACAGMMPLVINLRFSLRSLMLMVISGAACVTMMIAADPVFKTIGALGFLVWLLIFIAALSRTQMNDDNL
jgi:hypothetical protein